jgi:hypothetical protein
MLSRRLIAVLATLAAVGTVVSVAGLLVSSPDQEGSRLAYVGGLTFAGLALAMVVWLGERRRVAIAVIVVRNAALRPPWEDQWRKIGPELLPDRAVQANEDLRVLVSLGATDEAEDLAMRLAAIDPTFTFKYGTRSK